MQFADEELIHSLGELVYPGFIQRSPGENGLRLWVEGTRPEDKSRDVARFQFRVLLGALRSWRRSAGELRVERLDGLGPAAARDSAGNQWMAAQPALIYDLTGDPHLAFGRDVAASLFESANLANAFWLNGRTSRNSADFYMIHEYAEREFGGVQGIRTELDLSTRLQSQLTQSANNLSPRLGGRHADPPGQAPWPLARQQSYISDLLQRWVFRSAHSRCPDHQPYARRRS